MIREIFMKDLARFTYFNAKMTTDISTYKFVVLPGWMVQPLWLTITHGDPEFKILHTARSRSKTEIFNQWKFTFKCTTCIIKLRARRLYNIPTITHIKDIYNGDNIRNYHAQDITWQFLILDNYISLLMNRPDFINQILVKENNTLLLIFF